MNCLALLAHCHRTGTRIQLFDPVYTHNNSNTNRSHANTRPRIQNVMEASLYDRSPVRVVIAPEAMQNLLETSVSVVLHNNDSQCCPITQEEFADGDAVLMLPCGHTFIKDAIQMWLETERAECPVCRYALPSREIITYP